VADAEKPARAFPFIWIGIAGTVLWGVAVFYYLSHTGGLCTIFKANFNEVGDFLAGIFSSLAFLWFVLALLMQSRQIQMQAEELALQRQELQQTRKTLESQRDEMKEAARQAKAQAEAVRANELHARRASFYQLVFLIERELVFHASRLSAKLYGVKVASVGWERLSQGNPFSFQRQIVNLSQKKDVKIFHKPSEENAETMKKYCRIFEKLLEASDGCDDNFRNIRGQFEWSPNGELYALLCFTISRESKIEVADHSSLVRVLQLRRE
jgi:hypothetical protein